MTTATRPWIGTALAATLLAVSGPSIAQNPAPAGQAPQLHSPASGARHADMFERMKAHQADRQARLKERLQLTPAQEPAWNALVTELKPREKDASARQGWETLTTPQRLDRMEAMRQSREQAMQKRHAAIRAFYAQLTPAQQKTFDEEGMGGWHRASMKGDMQEGRHRHGMHRM